MSPNRASKKIIIPHGVKIWYHELLTAQALVNAGYALKFLDNEKARYVKSPDILMNSKKWEIKSPQADKLSTVERNLKRAYRQSMYIIFDSRRMSKLRDKSIQKELVKQFKLTRKIKKILFVNRRRDVVDISSLS